MKCRCRVRDWKRRGALPPFFSSILRPPRPSTTGQVDRPGRRRAPAAPGPTVNAGATNSSGWLRGREGAGAGRRSREEGREGDRGCGMERSYH